MQRVSRCKENYYVCAPSARVFVCYVCLCARVWSGQLAARKGATTFPRFSRVFFVFFHRFLPFPVFLLFAVDNPATVCSACVLYTYVCVCIFAKCIRVLVCSPTELCISLSLSSSSHRFPIDASLFFFFFRLHPLVFFRMVSPSIDDRRARPSTPLCALCHGRSEVVITSSRSPMC